MHYVLQHNASLSQGWAGIGRFKKINHSGCTLTEKEFPIQNRLSKRWSGRTRTALLTAHGNKISFNEYNLAYSHPTYSISYSIDFKTNHTLWHGKKSTVLSFNALVICGFWFGTQPPTTMKKHLNIACRELWQSHLWSNKIGPIRRKTFTTDVYMWHPDATKQHDKIHCGTNNKK